MNESKHNFKEKYSESIEQSILKIDFYTVFLHKLSPLNQGRYEYLCNMSLLIPLFLEMLCNFCAVCMNEYWLR